jgi:hypothetical protein
MYDLLPCCQADHSQPKNDIDIQNHIVINIQTINFSLTKKVQNILPIFLLRLEKLNLDIINGPNSQEKENMSINV